MHRTVLRLSALVVLVAISGCGTSETGPSGSAGASSAPTTTAVREPLYLYVKAPDSVRSSLVKLRGRATPGSVVRVGGKKTTVKSDGTWLLAVAAKRGENTYEVTASQDGYEPADDFAFVTRNRSKAEIARAVAARKAREERRRQAAAERRARAEAREAAELDSEINRVLSGSGEKMSKVAARIISDRCTAGAIDDFDICFEAGYVIGKNAAESAIEKYE